MQTEHRKDFWPIWDYLVEIWRCVFFCFFFNLLIKPAVEMPPSHLHKKNNREIFLGSKEQKWGQAAWRSYKRCCILIETPARKKKETWQFECSFCSGSWKSTTVTSVQGEKMNFCLAKKEFCSGFVQNSLGNMAAGDNKFGSGLAREKIFSKIWPPYFLS